MSGKKFKKLRKLASKMSELGHHGTKTLPEAYTQDRRRVLNPGKPKGAYRWLKKNAKLAERK
jgi:hypothetical protein